MGQQPQKRGRLTRWIAIFAIMALLSTVFIAFLIPTSNAQLDLNLNAGGLEDSLCEGLGQGGVLGCGDDSASSFTTFEGEFVAPEESGYAEGITQTSSAREFIVNVTNFVLSFLGLAAVIMVIYGGFMYVTAAGEQERVEKGKKSVIYAIVGILIVLISFALVNTVISGAGGGSDDPATGLYQSGAVGESLSEFQTDQMAQNVKLLTQDFVEEFTTYANLVSIAGAMFDVQKFDKAGLRDLEDGFELALKEADPFSQTADEARAGLRLIEPLVSSSLKDKVVNLASNGQWVQTNALLTQVDLDNQDAVCADACGPFIILGAAYGACFADCQANPNKDLFQYSTEQAKQAIDPFGISADVVFAVKKVAMAAHNDFTTNMSEIVGDITDLKESFTDQTTILTLLEGDTAIIGQLSKYTDSSQFEEVTEQREYLPDTTYNIGHHALPFGGSRDVGNTVEKMNELYNLVLTLKFTTAVINASTSSGNAPLTVTFDGLDSFDPTELTVTDEQYKWDLLGNGFDASGSKGDNQTGPNVSFTYTEPGTYRVGLSVTSNDSANIASGISYLSIKVNPPSSIINLVTTGGLSNLPEDVTERSTVSFTGEDAKAGITFDASGTTDGDGNTDTIVSFDFDFGDGNVANGENPEATNFYTEEGTYRFELEVTDQNGVKDRHRMSLVIASPAAHLEVSTNEAEIGEEVLFDASASLTDFGSINNYAWTITRGSESIYEELSGEDELKYEFDAPGEYTVQVEVTDSSGQSNATSTNVVVSSSEPVASFDFEMRDPARPNVFVLDGSSSFDPDEDDVLTYLWEIELQGYEALYHFIEGTDKNSERPIIEFTGVGDKPVKLTVSDQYEGDLKQSSSTVENLPVDSVLGLGVENAGESATFLNEDGTAEVELNLSTTTGKAFEVNWDDGSDVETFSNPGSLGSAPAGEIPFYFWGVADHEYTEAGTYAASVTVYDEQNNSNSLTRNIYIGNGTEPIPIINVFIDNVEAPDPNIVEANRNNTIRFDASGSVDLDGKPINQTGAFSWVLGDGSRSTGKTLTKQYEDTGDFEVTLTVRSTADSTISSNITINLSVVDTPPEIYGLIVQPQDDELVTPLVVKAEANAVDEDGQITRYKFWYFDVNNSSETLGEQISLSPQTFLTINTSGTTGELKEYAFAVEVTDDENNTVSSFDEIPQEQMPTLEVENGPNSAPQADFTVDRTNVLVGETVTFTSSSIDEDGSISEYIWDFEGDGFFNNSPSTDSTVLYEFDQALPEGVEVRLKVTDDTGATDVSNPVRVFVDSLTNDPTAAFIYTTDVLTVTFTNNSKADSENNAELVGYEWDFDTSSDADGDGDSGNDLDSDEENPEFTYENFGRHTVELTVTDNEGNTDTVSNVVDIVQLDPPEARFDFEIVEGLSVDFENASIPGSESAPIETYKWDFDGDGATDSDDESPRYEFEDYGTFRVELTVTDLLGRSDEYRKSITIEEPEPDPLVAFLTTQPAGDPRRGGDVYLPGTNGNIIFSFRSEGAVGDANYCIDKNVFFDTDGNGQKDDDCDHEVRTAGSWTTNFDESWGNIVVRLIVTDSEGREYTVTKQVKFEKETPALGGASIMPVTTGEALYILGSALAFTLLGAKLYTRKEEEYSI
jgi:PKD repeat protein